MKKVIFEVIILFTVLFSCGSVIVYSADLTDKSNVEFDGYIVSMEVDPNLVSLNEENGKPVKPIVEEENLYFAEDEAEVERLKSIGNVKYVEPNYIVELADVDISKDYANDMYTSDLWNYKMINADITLKNGYLGDGVRVGVIDSGLNTNHIDFVGTVGEGYNYYGNNDNISDTLGHGSFVSGIICARLNDTGMIGITPNVELVTLKAFEGKNTALSHIIEAIYAGVNVYNCDVFNMSFALTSNAEALRDAINYATKNGVICVTVSGNKENSSTDNSIRYPAGYDNALAVGSVMNNGKVYAGSVKNSSVFVTAPGVNVPSINYLKDNGYKTGSGTSYAAPHLTGLVAILKSIDKNISFEKVKEIIMNTSTDIDAEGYDENSGYGLINVQAAVEYMLKSKTVYRNKLYAKQNGNIIFTNLNVVYRQDENADLLVALKDSSGIVRDIKIFDVWGSEFKNFEYFCDTANLEAGEYSLEYYLLGRNSVSPLYNKFVLSFVKKDSDL